MAKAPPSAKRNRIKDFVPALVDYTNDVLDGEGWERKELSKRDRSLITGRPWPRPTAASNWSATRRAIDNGVTPQKITEMITHMAFYAGWPAAMSAAQVAYTAPVEGGKGK